MTQSFYTAFEDRYRGSGALIRERLAVYEPLARCSGGPVLDLGCGRGEWLQLLRDWRLEARGVDLEPAMVKLCQQQGLAVEAVDAIAALRGSADASLGMVTALHLVEHLPFELLNELVRECRRVLRPDGFLLMETPNAENLLVGANDFYTDPTHLKPLPSNLLRFLPECHGFHRSDVVRLHELLPGERLIEAGLLGVLAGVSMDYAVVAQPAHHPPAEAALKAWMQTLPGVSLQQACAGYDQLRYEQLEHLNHGFESCEAQIAELKQQQLALEDRLCGLAEQLHQVWLQSVHHAEEVHALRRRFSWRLTAPLRWCSARARRLARWLVRRDANGRIIPAVQPRQWLQHVLQPDAPPPMLRDARDLWRASEDDAETRP